MAEPLLQTLEAGVLTLVLNRPEKLNSFNDALHLALRAALERAQDDPEVRCVLLTGAGRAFCAGQDLGDRDPRKMDGPPDLGHTLDSFYNPTLRLIRALPKPMIAAVNGVAAGAGANVALACDIVLAAESARFIQSFAKIGLTPDAGGSWMLTRLLGEARAKGLALLGEPLPARIAADWGLIWKALPDDELMAEAAGMARQLATGPTLGLGLTKMSLQAAATNSYEAQLDIERDNQRSAGQSADYAEGVTAFLEKRPARFTGQ
jgi:2-(1,2-epoxy-1,2-dihydrophenyl)acetyl-CoA isomerase